MNTHTQANCIKLNNAGLKNNINTTQISLFNIQNKETDL